MADGLNRVLLLGNLGADPELRVTQGGHAVLSMSLATSESWKDRNGQRQERTEWHKVAIWGKRAEGLSKFLSKGSRIAVEGGLRTSSYDDREGIKRYKTEIVARNVVLLDSRRSSPAPASKDDPPSDEEYPEGFYGGSGDDDIPF